MQALFKARFEQALESQKLNIKKIEQQLRRMNINPDDPVAMASIQRVASTFFNAIDKKEGSPYVFHGDKPKETGGITVKEPESGEDSDQEELDKFIAEIEDAADREWEEEEAAEKEEVNRIRYLYREDYDGRYTKPDMGRRAPPLMSSNNSENDDDDDDDDDEAPYVYNERNRKPDKGRRAPLRSSNREEDDDDDDEAPYVHDVPKVERWERGKNGNTGESRFVEEEPESEDMLDELENVMFESDEENLNIGNRDEFLKGHGKDDSRDPGILISESESEPESAKKVDEKWDSD